MSTWAKLIQRESQRARRKTAVSAQRSGHGRRCARTRLLWAAEAFWCAAAGIRHTRASLWMTRRARSPATCDGARPNATCAPKRAFGASAACRGPWVSSKGDWQMTTDENERRAMARRMAGYYRALAAEWEKIAGEDADEPVPVSCKNVWCMSAPASGSLFCVQCLAGKKGLAR